MNPVDRRRFLSSLGRAGALLATASSLDVIGYTQAALRLVRSSVPTGRS